MKNVDTESGSLGEGVYYASEDYAGLIRRFIIIGVDLVVIYFASIFVIVIFFDLPAQFDQLISSKLYVVLVLSYLYLAIIKRSDWGTVGYRLTGVRIVNLRGDRPSLWQMTLRFLLLVFGPLHFLLDILWLGGDEYKQTLRDKIVGTYVIRHDALPLGRGEQLLVQYYLFAWTLMFREVKRSH
jgi:uncharacterized RDD family membrane protein YckC